MDQSDQESQVSATFILCAFPDDQYEYHWNPSTSTLKEVHDELTERFNIQGEDIVLLFHRVGEPCWIARPHSDLFDLSRNSLHGQTLCLHPHLNISFIPNWQTPSFTKRPKISTGRGAQGPEQPNGENRNLSNSDRSSRSSTLSDLPDDLEGVNGKRTTIGDSSADTAENEKPTRLKIHIQFKSRSINLDPKVWEPTENRFKVDTKLQVLLKTLRDETEERFARDDKLIRMRKNILFRPEMQLVPEFSRNANPDPFGKSHVRILGDLFPYLIQKSKLPITVTLEDSGKVCRSKEAKEVLINDWQDESTYYRVGAFQKQEKTAYGTTQRAAQEHVLLAWYNHGERRELNDLNFSEVPVWTANNLLIGDNDLGKHVNAIPNQLTTDGRYRNRATKSVVHNFVSNKAENQESIHGLKADVPQAPTHCFNDADEGMKYVGDPKGLEDDQTITVTGPFVHYTEDNDREDKSLIPETFNIKVKAGHSVDDIYGFLDYELRRAVDGKKRMEKLFKEKARKFKYDLWVLPQKSGVRKMFRYREGKVTRFMTTKGVKDKEDVYMQAHVVPMEVDGNDAG